MPVLKDLKRFKRPFRRPGCVCVCVVCVCVVCVVYVCVLCEGVCVVCVNNSLISKFLTFPNMTREFLARKKTKL